ncbi:MAG: hypothetical protein M1837_005376 [Sclerophora amabilis]|nr:MAG: hypothetical protein M1837_005376 [Sclerophora amabilis]
MSDSRSSYPKHPRSTVNRYKNIANYDYEAINSIVNASPVLHVSFPASHDADEDPFPAILPMIGVMSSFSSPDAPLSTPMECYLHGYASSRIMRLAPSDPAAEADPTKEPLGLPVAIASTIVNGIVLALTPNSHSYNYRSAVLHGFATPVTSLKEKTWAMERITNKVMTDRWAHTRVPPNKTEMTSTQILKVRVVSASAKIRLGGPHDDRKDLKNDEVRDNVWAGVVPVWQTYGDPVPAEGNRVAACPDHVTDFVSEENAKKKAESLKALEEPEKKVRDQ